MTLKSNLLNYFGQLRIYSIVDLMILLFASFIGMREFFGVIFLHVGFILYLEFRHKHTYRRNFAPYLWGIFWIIGIISYWNISVIGFLLASIFYAEKKRIGLSPLAPFFRGLQYYFIIAGLVGFSAPLALISGFLLIIRNFAGDLRDITKDKKEKLRTLPIVLGFRHDHKYIHLASLLITSLIWWHFSDLEIAWLLIAYAIEIATYNLTPR